MALTVISNTTPIITLLAIDKFDLLPQLFKKIYVPYGVYQEIEDGKHKRFWLSDNFCGKSLVGIFKMYFLFCSSLYRRSDLNKISIFTCFSAYFNLVIG